MYRKDLRLFRYPSYTTISIGWLGMARDFPRGKVSVEFFNQISTWCSDPAKYGVYSKTDRTRGIKLTPTKRKLDSIDWYKDPSFNKLASYPSEYGEIHVKHKGKYYASPLKLYQNIHEYGYLPPPEFIEAVLEGELIDSQKKNALDHKFAQKKKGQSIADSPDKTFKAERHIKKCEHHLKNGENTAAEREVEAALQLNPQDVKGLFYRARISFDKEAYATAHTAIEELIELRPGLEIALAMRGLILFKQKKFAEAEADLLHVLPGMRKNPGNNLAQSLYFLGKIASKKHRYKQAQAYYNESLAINPEDKEIKRTLTFTNPLAFISSKIWEKKK